MRMFLFLQSVLQHVFTIIARLYQLCDIVNGLREAQAWSILDSVSWSMEQAVDLALQIAQENENITSPARGYQMKNGVFVVVVALFILVLVIIVIVIFFCISTGTLTIFHVVDRQSHQIKDSR